MKQRNLSERGQALVIIAFAIIGLVALTALAIDGGNVYSDRRNAQNAADTAVFATALHMIRNPDVDPGDANENWIQSKEEGRKRAASNGYDNDGVGDIVEVEMPPIIGPYSDCSSTEFDCNEYVQVIITSNVNTYFAPIVGITKLTNKVNAVARVEKFPPIPPVFGNAIIGLNEHDCAAVKIGGNSSAILKGGGLHVNSDCTANPPALNMLNSKDALDAPSVCVVGTFDKSKISAGTTISPDCTQVNPKDAFVEPNIVCSQDAVQTGAILSPGNFDVKNFPAPKVFPPKDVTKLEPGIYCVTGDFEKNTGVLTGSNVLIFMKTGQIKLTGGEITLTAIADPNFKYKGLLFAFPSSNASSVTITGNSDMFFKGTILAPSSLVNIDGSSASEGFLNSQILSDKVEVLGGGDTIINYTPDDTWKPIISPQIEFME